MAIDPLRHLSVFKPHAFGDRQVDIIGCGATGSKIAMEIVKLGVENVHLYDFDKVEEHNIANQVFGIPDIGKFKVDALADIIENLTATKVTKHNERVDGNTELGSVVFLLTDTMKSRKEIFEGALKLKLRTDLLIETRMGADSGRIYTIDPNQPDQIEKYEATLYDDSEAEVSACGASTTVGPTASIIAGMAVWQMIRWFSIQQGIKIDDQLDALENELIISMRTSSIILANKY